MVEPRVSPLDLAGESLTLLRRQHAAMAAHEQGEAEIGLELRHRAADMGLPDAESRSGPRHPAMAQDGAEEIEMSRGSSCLFRMDIEGESI